MQHEYKKKKMRRPLYSYKKAFKPVYKQPSYFKINVRENRGGNQECTTQKHWQQDTGRRQTKHLSIQKHWQQDTGRRQTKHLSTQKTLATRHRTKTNKTPLNTENIGNMFHTR